MGVNGILPRVLPAAGHQIDLTQFRNGVLVEGKRGARRPIRIALDVSGWIAKACHGYGSMLMDDRHLSNYGRATLFNQQREETSEKDDPAEPQAQDSTVAEQEFVRHCANFVLKKIVNLRDNCKARILVVLDGASPPIKANVCRERRDRRKEAAQQRDLPVGDEDERAEQRLKAARRAGAENPKLHGTIVAELLKALRLNHITFLVSPYEADGQLAYLSQCGYSDLIITDDSDLIGHGANAIVYKLDEGNCQGILLQRHDLGATNKQCSLLDFSNAMLATMFVAAGCDYCESLRGIGIVKARNIVKSAFHGQECYEPKRRHVHKHDEPALAIVFRQLYQNAYEKNMSVQAKEEYEETFLAALLVYRHPVVFDPVQGRCLLAGDPPHGSDPELLKYEPYAQLCRNSERMQQLVGRLYNPMVATLVAEGWVNPRTRRLYENTDIPENIQEMWLREQSSSEQSSDDDKVMSRQDTAAAETTDDHQMETQEENVELTGGNDIETQEDIVESSDEGELRTQDDIVHATIQNEQVAQNVTAKTAVEDGTEGGHFASQDSPAGEKEGGEEEALHAAAKTTNSGQDTSQRVVDMKIIPGGVLHVDDLFETSSENESAEPNDAQESRAEVDMETADENVAQEEDVEEEADCEHDAPQDVSSDMESEEDDAQDHVAVEETEGENNDVHVGTVMEESAVEEIHSPNVAAAEQSGQHTPDTVDFNVEEATDGSQDAMDEDSPPPGTQYSEAIEILDSDDDDGFLETQEICVPQHIGSISQSVDLPQNSSGASSMYL